MLELSKDDSQASLNSGPDVCLGPFSVWMHRVSLSAVPSLVYGLIPCTPREVVILDVDAKRGTPMDDEHFVEIIVERARSWPAGYASFWYLGPVPEEYRDVLEQAGPGRPGSKVSPESYSRYPGLREWLIGHGRPAAALGAFTDVDFTIAYETVRTAVNSRWIREGLVDPEAIEAWGGDPYTYAMNQPPGSAIKTNLGETLRLVLPEVLAELRDLHRE